VTLKEAAQSLGITPASLRQAIARGSLRGRKVGNTWTVTPREVERYRVESLGRRGRRPLHAS
jgi:excisionase family DNA binding protein